MNNRLINEKVKNQKETNFFVFYNDLIRSRVWANLPLSAKAIYPVITMHADWVTGKGAFPSLNTISELSGVSKKGVTIAIEALVKAKLLKKHKGGGRINTSYDVIFNYPGSRLCTDYTADVNSVHSRSKSNTLLGVNLVHPNYNNITTINIQNSFNKSSKPRKNPEEDSTRNSKKNKRWEARSPEVDKLVKDFITR